MKLKQAGFIALSVVMPASLSAETGSGNEIGSQREVNRLERSIQTTRVRNLVIKKKNEELSARMKDLESRIAEMKKSLKQEEQREE
jgi:TolA-binding protein